IGHLDSILQSQSRFAGAGLAENEGGCPSIQPTAAQVIQCLDAAGNRLVLKPGMMLGRDHARKNAQTAGGNDVVMIAFAEFHGPQFRNPQPAARCAVAGREMFNINDAVREAEYVGVEYRSRLLVLIVAEKNRALELRELPF